VGNWQGRAAGRNGFKDGLGELQCVKARPAVNLWRRAHGDAGEESIDLRREVVAPSRSDPLSLMPPCPVPETMVSSGFARSAISRRPGSVTATVRSAAAATRLVASVATTPFSKRDARLHRIAVRVATDYARRLEDDRRCGEGQREVDVVDHQVEDDVDVEGPARPRRAPDALDHARRRHAREARGKPAQSASMWPT
jgi:hypothetical protein